MSLKQILLIIAIVFLVLIASKVIWIVSFVLVKFVLAAILIGLIAGTVYVLGRMR